MIKFFKSTLSSFKNAFRGIGYNLRKGRNFQVQITIAILTIIAGFIFNISNGKWAVIIILIGAVLSAEVMNTAIEKICDRFYKEEDQSVKIIKDSAAGAVLILSIAAFIVGVIIFWPYLKGVFN